MDEGLPIRENPSLQTISVNRLISVGWDGDDIVLTLGRTRKLPKKLGGRESEVFAYPSNEVAMPPELTVEVLLNTIMLLRQVQPKMAEQLEAILAVRKSAN